MKKSEYISWFMRILQKPSVPSEGQDCLQGTSTNESHTSTFQSEMDSGSGCQS